MILLNLIENFCSPNQRINLSNFLYAYCVVEYRWDGQPGISALIQEAIMHGVLSLWQGSDWWDMISIEGDCTDWETSRWLRQYGLKSEHGKVQIHSSNSKHLTPQNTLVVRTGGWAKPLERWCDRYSWRLFLDGDNPQGRFSVEPSVHFPVVQNGSVQIERVTWREDALRQAWTLKRHKRLRNV